MSPRKFDIKEHIVPCQYVREYPGSTLDDQEATLQLHVKRYKPKDQTHNRPGAVTIIGAHANGFPKVYFMPNYFPVRMINEHCRNYTSHSGMSFSRR